MQTALRLTARVQAGHRLEIVAPELTEGEEVTILVTPTAQTAPDPLRPTPPEASAPNHRPGKARVRDNH
jgi:hypothetical protein